MLTEIKEKIYCYYCRKEIQEINIKLSYHGKCFVYDCLDCLKKHINEFQEFEQTATLF